MKWALATLLMVSSAFCARSFSAPAPTTDQKMTALAAATDCESLVRFDDRYLYLGFGGYLPREGASGKLHVIELAHPENSFDLITRDGVVDVVSAAERLFVLTFSSLEEWSLASHTRVAVYSTYVLGRDFQYKENPTGFYLDGTKLIISHGRLGYSIFDTARGELIGQSRFLLDQFPLESMAVGVAGAGHRAVFAMDSFTLSGASSKPAYRGMLVMNLTTGEIMKNIPGTDPGAESINVVGDRLVIGFNPAVWKYDLRSVLTSDEAAALSIVSQWPGGGMFLGKVDYDDQSIYGCYRMEMITGGVRKSVRLPWAFNRKDLELD